MIAGIQFENVSIPWLWLLLLVAGSAVLVLTYLDIFRRSGRSLTWGLLGLRGLGLFFLVLALAKPTWTREREEIDPGHVVVIVDNSRSMSLTDGSSTRYGKARKAVEELTAGLQKGSKTRPVVDLFDIEGNPLQKFPEDPTVDRTDLEKAIRQSIKKMRSRNLAGVVVISDGMDTTGRSSFQDWRDSTVPVHALGFPATSTGDLDLAVRRPRAPERALVHNALTIDVPITKTGKNACSATVSIKRGRETVESQKVELPAGGSEREVSLTFTPRQPGRFVYTAAIESDSGERYLGNNAVHFPLRVDAEPIRVLYVEGYLRTEAKFLKAQLADDPDVRLTWDMRRPTPDTPNPIVQVLFREEVLKDIDVIILGDMEGRYLRKQDYEQIVKWLDGKNHSLLVLGGYSSFGPEGFHDTPLAAVLPVVFRTTLPYQSEKSVGLELTEKGKQHPLFSLSGDRVKDAEDWAKAPKLEGMAVAARLKPGAEDLAVNPELQVEGKPATLLATQRAAGGGHVMVLTADTTWRWSRFKRILGQPDTLYSRFWSQAIRWLAGRSLDDQRPPITVSTDKPDYEANQKVTVKVLKQPGADQEKAKGELSVEVTQPDKARQPHYRPPPPLTLKPDATNPDLLSAEFYPQAGGRYEVTATLTDAGKLKASQVSEFLVQGTDLEMASPATSPATLKSLADATGGVFLNVDEAESLADRIERKPRRTASVARTEFWNSPWLFLAFLTAVSAEWFIRRKNHLI
jgi:hypothetical protein